LNFYWVNLDSQRDVIIDKNKSPNYQLVKALFGGERGIAKHILCFAPCEAVLRRSKIAPDDFVEQGFHQSALSNSHKKAPTRGAFLWLAVDAV